MSENGAASLSDKLEHHHDNSPMTPPMTTTTTTTKTSSSSIMTIILTQMEHCYISNKTIIATKRTDGDDEYHRRHRDSTVEMMTITHDHTSQNHLQFSRNEYDEVDTTSQQHGIVLLFDYDTNHQRAIIKMCHHHNNDESPLVLQLNHTAHDDDDDNDDDPKYHDDGDMVIINNTDPILNDCHVLCPFTFS